MMRLPNWVAFHLSSKAGDARVYAPADYGHA